LRVRERQLKGMMEALPIELATMRARRCAP